MLFAGCGQPPDQKHYHIDRLGTVQAISDFDGNLIEQIRYAAYGNLGVRTRGSRTTFISRSDLRAERS